jgi:hypothetical protein
MINSFRKLTRGSRQARRGISAALSIQRMFLPLMTAVKHTKKPQSRPHALLAVSPKKQVKPHGLHPEPLSTVLSLVLKGDVGAQTTHATRLNASEIAARSNAARLHTICRRFCGGYGDEQARRRGWISSALPSAIVVREPDALLELAPSRRSKARQRGAGVGCGADPPNHQKLQGKLNARLYRGRTQTARV